MMRVKLRTYTIELESSKRNAAADIDGLDVGFLVPNLLHLMSQRVSIVHLKRTISIDKTVFKVELIRLKLNPTIV